MGSISEEELIQMVRDYYESSESNYNTNPLPPSPSPHQLRLSTLQDILLEASDSEREIQEKVSMYVRNMGEPNTLKKWVVKRLQMDGYKASLCKLTYWVSTFGLAKGDYEYIEVMMNSSTRLIVEMEFKSQFELARPTQSYKALLGCLPSMFVGTEDRLNRIISVLCSGAKDSLREKGLHIPPWRRAKFMRSKWVSKNCNRISIDMEFEINGDQISSLASCCPSIF